MLVKELIEELKKINQNKIILVGNCEDSKDYSIGCIISNYGTSDTDPVDYTICYEFDQE